MLQLNPSIFLFDFLLFLIIFLPMFQEAMSALRVLKMLNRYITSLGKTLAFSSFVCNNAHHVLGHIADSSSLAMGTFVTYFFHCCNITFLVDSHVCGQRNNSTFCKRPREHAVGASPLSLCVCILHMTGRWFQLKNLSFVLY